MQFVERKKKFGHQLMGIKRYHWWNHWMFPLGQRLAGEHEHPTVEQSIEEFGQMYFFGMGIAIGGCSAAILHVEWWAMLAVSVGLLVASALRFYIRTEQASRDEGTDDGLS